MLIASWREVLEFWFDTENIPLHFDENEEFDNIIREKFLSTWEMASEGLLVDWRRDIKGRLAEIIVLDQFSRNLWRNNIKTYTQDKMAIALAQEAIYHPDYITLSSIEKRYILLPFMHSESVKLHDWAFKYYENVGDDNLIWFEKMHREVLDRFGRYPYQNEDLGRHSTPEELDYLKEKNGNFY